MFVVEYPGPDSEPLVGKNGLSKITLKVFLRDFDEVKTRCPSVASTLIYISIFFRQGFEGVDTTSLKPSAVLEGLDSLSSSQSLKDCTSQLRSVFDVLDANVGILRTVTQLVEGVASVSCPSHVNVLQFSNFLYFLQAHPLAKAAVSALLIPYKVSRQRATVTQATEN